VLRATTRRPPVARLLPLRKPPTPTPPATTLPLPVPNQERTTELEELAATRGTAALTTRGEEEGCRRQLLGLPALVALALRKWGVPVRPPLPFLFPYSLLLRFPFLRTLLSFTLPPYNEADFYFPSLQLPARPLPPLPPSKPPPPLEEWVAPTLAPVLAPPLRGRKACRRLRWMLLSPTWRSLRPELEEEWGGVRRGRVVVLARRGWERGTRLSGCTRGFERRCSLLSFFIQFFCMSSFRKRRSEKGRTCFL
jgi:hypothetical protein